MKFEKAQLGKQEGKDASREEEGLKPLRFTELQWGRFFGVSRPYNPDAVFYGSGPTERSDGGAGVVFVDVYEDAEGKKRLGGTITGIPVEMKGE